MRGIKLKIFLSIIICSILISVLVGFESISNSTNVAEADSREKLNLICQNKTNQLNSKIGKVEASVNTLSEIALETLDDVNKFSSDEQYVKDYQDKIEPIAKKFGENTVNRLFYENGLTILENRNLIA